MPELHFGKGIKSVEDLTKEEAKIIKQLYQNAWKKNQDKFDMLQNMPQTATAYLQSLVLKDLQESLEKDMQEISKVTEQTIKNAMEEICNKTIDDVQTWLNNISPKFREAYGFVAQDVVSNIVTGKIYQKDWEFSKAIWGDYRKTNGDISQIVATGLATGKTTFEIAKDLEKYVNPSAAKPWDWSKVYPGVKKQVDYNAQRMARTMITHAYQQSVAEISKNNPFVSGVRWISAFTKTTCELCESRHNQIYKPEELPLDHPNGKCSYAAVINDKFDDIADRLSEWVLGKEDQELNRYAEYLGFEFPKMSLDDYKNLYGNSKYKTVSTWLKKLPDSAKSDIEKLKEQSGLSWNDFYSQNFYAGIEIKKFNDQQKKYLSPYGFSVDNMPKNFDDWSHKVSHDQALEILKSLGTSWADPHPYQQLQKYYESNLTAAYLKSEKSFDTKPKTEKVQAKNQQSFADLFDYKNWISLLNKQTEKQMLNLENENMKLLNDNAKSGIINYSSSAYRKINNYFRLLGEGVESETARKQVYLYSDELNGLNAARKYLQSVVTKDTIYLRRGTDVGDIAGLFMSGSFSVNKEKLQKMSAAELNDMFEGAVGQYSSFTSTSSLYDRGFPRPLEIIFKAPPGTAMSSIMKLSQFGTAEGETLLDAETRVRCIKIEDSDGHMSSAIRMYLEIITDDKNKK